MSTDVSDDHVASQESKVRKVRFPLVCALLSLCLFATYAWAGLCLGNAGERVSSRMRIHAIPIAVSYLYQGRPHDLTGWKQVEAHFRNPRRSINDLIKQFLAPRKDVEKGGVYYWTADDRGMGDFATLAFMMFGPQTSSLYWFYIVILGTSIGAYMLALWRDARAMFALVLLMGGSIVFLHLAPLNGPWFQFGERNLPIHDSRTFDALSIFGFATILAVGLGRVALTPRVVAGLSIQVVLLAFLLLARSSIKLGLLVLAVVFVAAACAALVRAWRRDATTAASPHRWAIGLSAVVSVYALASVYQTSVYNARYATEVRTVWHNALMGVGVPEAGLPFPANHVNDLWAASVVSRQYNKTRPPGAPAWDPQKSVLNSLGGATTFDWPRYEREARSIYMGLWRKYPGKLLKWYLFDKPLQLLGKLWQSASMEKPITAPEDRWCCPARYDAELTLLHWPVIAAMIVLAFFGRKEIAAHVWPCLGVFLAGSVVFLIPSILFYGFIFNLSAFVVLTAGAAFGLFAWLVALGLDWLAGTWRKPSQA